MQTIPLATSAASRCPEVAVSELLLVHPFLCESAAANMATDLWSLLEYPQDEHPRYRHFDWKHPCVTFGYGQQFDWVCGEAGRKESDLCRRPTGGGIVVHGEDWTYSLVIPSEHHVCEGSAAEVYLHVHESLAVALADCGVETALLPCASAVSSEATRKVIPGQCFLEPVARDLVLPEDGTKVAGAAMKKTRTGILLQGTIDRRSLKKKVDWDTFEARFLDGLAAYLAAEPEPVPWPENFAELRAPYVEQFASSGWLRQRKSTLSRR